MKNLALLLAMLVASATFAFAQNKIYRTQHINVGFGEKSNCSQNQFLDFVVNGPLAKQVVVNNKVKFIPVGGYIDNGVQVQPYIDPSVGGGNFSVDNAIFGMDYIGNMHMVPYADRHSLPKMKWAFQNGPMLVYDEISARENSTSTSRFIRSGIGYKEDGTLVVIISENPVTFREFADLFMRENCENAIYLDGNNPFCGFASNTISKGMHQNALKLRLYNN